MKQSEKQSTGALLARVIKMDELVDYQKGAVVSREVVSKEAGTVTLFAFDEEQGLSEHKAPFDALIYVLEGNVRVTISGEEYKLQKADMIIMPANQPHALKAVGRFKMALVMIRS